jgi:hypothetical protein
MDYRSLVKGRTKIVFTALSNNLERSFRNLGLAFLLAAFSLSVWAEETAVKADVETSQKQSQKDIFESQIEIYNQTVSEEYKELVQTQLERSILNGPHIVKLYGRTRG